MGSILFDYRREVKGGTVEQVPKLRNEVDPDEEPVETKEEEDNRKVLTDKVHKRFNP